MIDFILSQFTSILHDAEYVYGVNPVIFLVIYLLGVPVFYYSLFRMLRALAAKRTKEVMGWGGVFLGTNLAPFAYVLFFGRNLPWWVYGVIALLVGQGVVSLILKIRGGSKSTAASESAGKAP